MESMITNIIIKYALREGLKRIGDLEHFKQQAEGWIRDEIGGMWEKELEAVALGALDIGWNIIIGKVEDRLKVFGVEKMSFKVQEELKITAPLTMEVLIAQGKVQAA